MDFTRASQVIKSLQLLIEKYGDLPICVDDPDTGWRMPFGIIHKQENIAEEWPERFEIKTDYHTTPKGCI